MPDLRSTPAEAPGSVPRFFVLAFAFTWAFQVPAVLGQRGLLPGEPASYLPLAVLGIFGPLVAATWLTARAEGRAGVRALYGSLLRWRVRWPWYLVALLLPGALLSLGLGLMSLAGYAGSALHAPGPERWLAIPIIAVAEEVGWRGYALPRLRRRYGALTASVVIGVLWTFWHVPMFVGQGIPLTTLPVMLLFFVGGSLFFTWIWARTGGSLLLAVLAHVGAHLNNAHVTLPDDALPLLVGTVVYALLGLGAVRFDRSTFPLAHRAPRAGPR